MTTTTVTEEQKAFIRANMDTMPRTAIARQLHIAVGTVYKYVRRYGGKMDYSLCTRLPESEERRILEMSRTMTNAAIRQATGRSLGTIQRVINRYGYKDDPERKARIAAFQRQNGYAMLAKTDRERRLKTWKLHRRIAEIKTQSGMDSGTGFRFRKLPRKVYEAIWHLEHCYNYFRTADDSREMLYDDETRRTPREAYYTRKYNITFAKAEEDETEEDLPQPQDD